MLWQVVVLSIASASLFAADRSTFDNDVRPVLAARCFSCDNTAKHTSGLNLETEALLLEGGSIHGPAVMPGNSAASPLLQYLRGEKKPAMPMGGSRLPPRESRASARGSIPP